MTTYYKATRPDGLDFYSVTIDYAGALASGKPVTVPAASRKLPAECCSPAVLHASDTPAETLIGGSWPCRLFEVTGRKVASAGHKHGFRSLRVVHELPAYLALGPNGEQVAAFIERVRRVTPAEATQLRAARDAAWDAAWDTTRDAAWNAARGAARNAAWEAAWDVAGDVAWGAARGAARGAAWVTAVALVVRDLISDASFKTLTEPWVSVMGAL